MGNTSAKDKNKNKSNTATTSTSTTNTTSSSSSSNKLKTSNTISAPPTTIPTTHTYHEDKAQWHVHTTQSEGASAAGGGGGGGGVHTPTPLHSRSSEIDNKSGFSSKKIDELFDKYKEKDMDEIGPEGVEQLCKDIGVDPEDVLVLVLAWHLNAQRMGYFSKEEFINGLQKLGVDNIAKLKGQLSNFKKDMDDQVKFKDIYRFSFGFAKEKETKILDLATADALLALVLGNRYPHTEPLRQFLKEQTTYKSINHDQWMNILEFSRSIKADLSNYDENSAWPVLLDEYCEWAKKSSGNP